MLNENRLLVSSHPSLILAQLIKRVVIYSAMSETPRAGVYIDGSNIYRGGADAGWHLDYQKFKEFLLRKYTLPVMSYYNSTGYKQKRDKTYVKDKAGNHILDPGALRFENFLRGLGIRVVTKPLKFINSDEHNASNKFDGKLMLDAFIENPQWDELILLSGDCDFESLVEQMVAISKPVRIFSFATRLSHELKILGFNSPYVSFTELETLESIVKRLTK